MRRAGSLRRRQPRRETPPERELRLAFVTMVNARSGYRCIREDDRCAGQLDAHHVTPKEALKKLAAARDMTRTETAALLWNPDNGVSVCRRHHDWHEKAFSRIPRRLIPEAAVDFAADLDLDYLLERNYPLDRKDRA